MQSLETKTCYRCLFEKSIDEFGVCKGRRDGRNFYCKSCIREKVAASRRTLKELVARNPNLIWKSEPTPVERVESAITIEGISLRKLKLATKLDLDPLGEILADLLHGKSIETRIVGGERVYYKVIRKPCVKREFKKPLSFVAIAASAGGFR